MPYDDDVTPPATIGSNPDRGSAPGRLIDDKTEHVSFPRAQGADRSRETREWAAVDHGTWPHRVGDSRAADPVAAASVAANARMALVPDTNVTIRT